ncbi:MAG: hypothetical protein IJW23_07360 [Lentisphaeria bacterium]|nr:hypothetical protein [Lentisphaeria bacterium]
MISMIRPHVQNYVRKSSFGFSVEKMPQEGIPSDFFLELPERFSAAEIPAYLTENQILVEGLSPVHACSLIEPGLLDNLSMSFPGLVRECILGINRMIESLAQKKIFSGVLNFDLNSLLAPEREKLYLTIIKGLAYNLERFGFTLLIPFAIPAASPEIVRQVPVFLRKTLLPWVKLRLDVHAHELVPGFSPETLAGGMFTEIRSIRFLYLADTGNVLIPEHILPWIETLSLYGFRGPYFFAPMTASLRGLPSWITANEKLIEKLESGV